MEDKTQPSNLPAVQGTFTLTGISKANQQYAYIQYQLAQDLLLLGITDYVSPNKLKGAQIVDGTVKIPLYEYMGSFKAYTSTVTVQNIRIFVSTQSELTQDGIKSSRYAVFSKLTFVNGSASKDFADPDMIQDQL
jgi:hypothetical protein